MIKISAGRVKKRVLLIAPGLRLESVERLSEGGTLAVSSAEPQDSQSLAAGVIHLLEDLQAEPTNDMLPSEGIFK